MRLSDLQSKDVINTYDGKKIGNIIDINIEHGSGQMIGLICDKGKFLGKIFSNKEEIEIRWNQIEKIGEDVILVRVTL